MQHYKTLGVPPEATPADLYAAHRKLARELHPDRNPAGAARMAEVNAAFTVLGDALARSRYDRAHGVSGVCSQCNGAKNVLIRRGFKIHEVRCPSCA